MLENSHLDLAVLRGIITLEQSQALSKLANSQIDNDGYEIDFSVAADDEPFRLLKGFRDFFIALGIIILAIGLSILVEAPFDFSTGRPTEFGAGDHRSWVATFSVLLLVIVALAISEWVTRRQRLPLSSLVLTIVFAVWSAMFFGALVFSIGQSFGFKPITSETLQALITIGAILGAVAALIVYYMRYKLPFVLLPLAGAAVAGVYFILDNSFNMDGNSSQLRLLTGVSGLGIFCLAMWYDLKDRYRATRLSECAFWLHLLASPMIVHSVFANSFANNFNGELGSITILVVVLMLAIFALIIDRRAILVSALIYMGFSIYKIIESFNVFGELSNSVTFVLLGVFILGLGLGWVPIRRFFVTNLVWKSLRDKLPPVKA